MIWGFSGVSTSANNGRRLSRCVAIAIGDISIVAIFRSFWKLVTKQPSPLVGTLFNGGCIECPSGNSSSIRNLTMKLREFLTGDTMEDIMRKHPMIRQFGRYLVPRIPLIGISDCFQRQGHTLSH